MKITGFWFLSFICLTIFAKSIGGQSRVVCYYTNWSVYRMEDAKFNPENIDPNLCTHLIYAFGSFPKRTAPISIEPSDSAQDIDKGGYAKFTGLKSKNTNLKTLLAIGGSSEGSVKFSKLVSDADQRRTFIENGIKYLRENGFDGLNVDWQHPTIGNGSKPEDRANYVLFLKELRDEFVFESSTKGQTRLLLTITIPAGADKINQGYDIVKLNQYVDWFNVVTYNYHDSTEPFTNYVAPLFARENETNSELNVNFSIMNLINVGADREKLVLGIPTFGNTYKLFDPNVSGLGAPTVGPGGTLPYFEICQSIKRDDKWTVIQPNDNAMGPYLYKDDQWISYDDENFVRKKAQYVKKNGLGGVMFWAIDLDDFRGTCSGKPYPLIEAAKAGLNDAIDSNNEDPVREAMKQNSSQTTTTANPIETTTVNDGNTIMPRVDFKCENEGLFTYPMNCKKYYYCLSSGPLNLGILAHPLTCPSGMSFNKQSNTCDDSRNVVCSNNMASTTVTTASPPITPPLIRLLTTDRATTSRPTTTSTTAPARDDDEIKNTEPEQNFEDPKLIMKLIDLVKMVGGINKLEKQLNILEAVTDNSNSDELIATQPKSKTKSVQPENKYIPIFDRKIINEHNKIQYQSNQPSRQDGKPVRIDVSDSDPFLKGKSFVTIQRQRTATSSKQSSEEDSDEDDSHEVINGVHLAIQRRSNDGSVIVLIL